MSHSGRPDIVFEAPPSAASNSSWTKRYSDFDPYRPENYLPYTTNSLSQRDSYYQHEIPLLPQRTPQDEQFLNEPSTNSPGLLRKSPSRKGKVPQFLSPRALKSHGRTQRDVETFDTIQYQVLNDKSSPGPETGATDEFFLKTPSPSLFPNGFGRPAKVGSHRFQAFRRGIPGFERPEWGKILLHIFLCLVCYPILLLVVVIAKDRNLFWCRAIVGVGCGLIGVSLGLSLVQLGKRFLEAATWATLIHQSNVPRDAPGIRLRDLASTVEEPTSMWAGLRLMWARYMYTGTARRTRKAYDKRPWTLFILLFLASSALAAILPFLLSRIVDIQTSIVHTNDTYHELAIKGDLSPLDIQKAVDLTKTFNEFALTWTISPFSALGNLPPAITLDYKGEKVYFAEAARSQFLPDGSGFGTFEQESTAPSVNTSTTDSPDSLNTGSSAETEPGNTLRYPRWGIRIHCTKISNGASYIVPRSPANLTYVFTPKDDLRSLFSSFDMDFPTSLDVPFNRTVGSGPQFTLKDNVTDVLPRGLDLDTASHFISSAFSDNGVAHSFKGFPISMGDDGKGFVQLEMLLVRLNTAYTPNGTFPVYSAQVADTPRGPGFIGYDAAVCLELLEPYVVEVYNSTSGLPSSSKVISRGASVMADISDDGVIATTRKGGPLNDPDVKRNLSSAGLKDVYDTLHGNSINQILKDNSRDAFYVPSPTIVSYTGGSGPGDYTSLSPEFFAQAKAKSDCSNILTYFAGSGDSLAWSFPDRVSASARVNNILVIALLGLVLAMGLIAGLFVPKLPLQVPRRGFTLYSWLLAFQGTELLADRSPALYKQMQLHELEREFGDLKFRYNGL